MNIAFKEQRKLCSFSICAGRANLKTDCNSTIDNESLDIGQFDSSVVSGKVSIISSLFIFLKGMEAALAVLRVSGSRLRAVLRYFCFITESGKSAVFVDK